MPRSRRMVRLGMSMKWSYIGYRTSQDYYWSQAWQDAERKALEEYERGEAVSFDSAEAAIEWLRSE